MGWGGGADKQLFEVKASVEVWSQLFCNMLMKGGGGGTTVPNPHFIPPLLALPDRIVSISQFYELDVRN